MSGSRRHSQQEIAKRTAGAPLCLQSEKAQRFKVLPAALNGTHTPTQQPHMDVSLISAGKIKPLYIRISAKYAKAATKRAAFAYFRIIAVASALIPTVHQAQTGRYNSEYQQSVFII